MGILLKRNRPRREFGSTGESRRETKEITTTERRGCSSGLLRGSQVYIFFWYRLLGSFFHKFCLCRWVSSALLTAFLFCSPSLFLLALRCVALSGPDQNGLRDSLAVMNCQSLHGRAQPSLSPRTGISPLGPWTRRFQWSPHGRASLFHGLAVI